MGVSLNCKQATKLLLEAEERPLSPVEMKSLEFHVEKCLCCGNLRGQMDFVRRALQQYATTGGTGD